MSVRTNRTSRSPWRHGALTVDYKRRELGPDSPSAAGTPRGESPVRVAQRFGQSRPRSRQRGGIRRTDQPPSEDPLSEPPSRNEMGIVSRPHRRVRTWPAPRPGTIRRAPSTRTSTGWNPAVFKVHRPYTNRRIARRRFIVSPWRNPRDGEILNTRSEPCRAEPKPRARSRRT